VGKPSQFSATSFRVTGRYKFSGHTGTFFVFTVTFVQLHYGDSLQS